MVGVRCTLCGLASENPPPDTREAKPTVEVEDLDVLTMWEPAEAQGEGHRETAMPYLTPSVEEPGVVAEWDQVEAQGLAHDDLSPLQFRRDIEQLGVTPDDGPVEATFLGRKGRKALQGSLYLNLEVLQRKTGVEEEFARPSLQETADAREALRPWNIRQWRTEVVTPGDGPVKAALLRGTRPPTTSGPGAEFSQSPLYIVVNFFFLYSFMTMVGWSFLIQTPGARLQQPRGKSARGQTRWSKSAGRQTALSCAYIMTRHSLPPLRRTLLLFCIT